MNGFGWLFYGCVSTPKMLKMFCPQVIMNHSLDPVKEILGLFSLNATGL